MRRICTICARGGSKEVANKNIRLIKDRPLIAYSIEQALDTKFFEHVVVSTDSDLISEIAVKYGAKVFFKRPVELATDTSAKIPVIRHALLSSEEFYKTKFGILVDLDATSPLRSKEDIINCVNLLEEKKYRNIITAMPARRSPYFNIVEVNSNGNVMLSKKLENTIVRRQDAPLCYDMNASIYVWERSALLDREGLFHLDTGLYIMPEDRSIDIDSSLDFEIVEFIMSRRENASK